MKAKFVVVNEDRDAQLLDEMPVEYKDLEHKTVYVHGYEAKYFPTKGVVFFSHEDSDEPIDLEEEMFALEDVLIKYFF